MKKERKVWAMTMIALWVLTPKPVKSQPDSLAHRLLNEVVVTATKFPKSAGETGKVLTTIDRDQLEKSTGKDIGQILQDQVGIMVAGANSNAGKDKALYLRGAKSEYTLVLVDGIPLNDPSAIGGGAYDLRLLPVQQIERIEILKGSQSTLYGSDAIAGVVNIITRKMGTDKLQSSLSASYGSLATRRMTGSLSGGIGSVRLRLSAGQMATAGISEAYDLHQTGGFDRDGYRQNSFQAGAEWRPTNRSEVQPYIRYAASKGEYDGGNSQDDEKNEYSYESLNAGFTSRKTWSKGSAQLLYGFNNTKRLFDGTFGASDYTGRFHHAEVSARQQLSDRWEIIGGISTQSWQMLDTSATEHNPIVRLASPYLSLFARASNGWSVELGGRINAHSEYGTNATYSVNPSWLLQRQWKLFANLSTGFKAPTLYQLFGEFGANPYLQPERARTSEVGFHFFSKRYPADFRWVAYHRSISNVIFYTYPEGYRNQDHQNDYGTEIEINWRLTKNFSSTLAYAYVDGFVRTPSVSDAKTYNLFRRPRHSLSSRLIAQLGTSITASVQVI